MKKATVFLMAMFAINMFSHAQLGKFAEKVKGKITTKANQRIDAKVDKQIDKGLDAAEGKNIPNSNTSGGNNTSTSAAPATAQTNEAPALKSFSKFDFVPGEKIVYSEDFAADAIGELPINWNTAGKAEVVTLDIAKGNWLRLYPTATFLTSNTTEFTKNFTVEFDIILDMHNTGYTYPYFSFGMISSGSLPPADNSLLKNYHGTQSTEIYFRLADKGGSSTYIETHSNKQQFFISEHQKLSDISNYYGKVAHISIQIQQSRVRVWVNSEKKFDLPKAMPVDAIFNNLFFRTHGSGYKEEELGFYISNLKVATGLPDTRYKLIEEGKFSTTGILFDVNTAQIKPESNGVLKEISDLLKKHENVRIQIIGHTDSDGNDAANMELSKKRAAAVKEALVTEFKINADRIETDGKGEAAPVGDNKTKEGKAQNRRVEFLKL